MKLIRVRTPSWLGCAVIALAMCTVSASTTEAQTARTVRTSPRPTHGRYPPGSGGDSIKQAQSGDVRLIVTGAVDVPMEDVRAAMERKIGHRLLIQYGSARGNLKSEILRGQGFEVAILTPDVTDELLAAGKITAQYVDIARAPAGIGVRGDVPAPDVSTPVALKAAILGAKALEWSPTGAALPTVNKILDTLGIRDQVAATYHRPHQPVPVALGPGEYELQIFPLSEILSRKRARSLGPVIAAFQVPQVIRAVISAHTPDPRAAKAVLAFLQGPAMAAALGADGLTAVSASADQPPSPGRVIHRRPPPPGTKALIEKVRDNLYVATTGRSMRDNVTFFITHHHGVVMFDTGNPGWGKIWLAALRKITDEPLRYVFITHDHADHTGSLPEMGDPLVRVAQENARKSLAQATCVERTGCQLFAGKNARYLPNKTFRTTLTMFTGKDQVKAYHFGASHTNGDAVYVIPSLHVALVGDIFAWRGVPRVLVDDSGSMLNYPRVLARLTSTIKGVDTVITGHSLVMTWKDLLEFRDFVTDYASYIRQAHDAGESVDEAMVGLPARLAKYKPCNPKVSRAAELQHIDCRFRTDYAALDAEIMYDELEGRVSTHGHEGAP